MIAQILGCLPLVWATQLEFLAPSFGLTHRWLLQSFGGVSQSGEDLPLLPLPSSCHSAFYIILTQNKQTKKDGVISGGRWKGMGCGEARLAKLCLYFVIKIFEMNMAAIRTSRKSEWWVL